MNMNEWPVHGFGRCVTEQPVLTHSSSGGHNDNFRFTFPSRFQELKSSGERDKLVLSEASFVHEMETSGGRNTFLLLIFCFLGRELCPTYLLGFGLNENV